ncbi:MAG: polyprenol monophosphomannose synthase [Anaerolineaceae bacterium]|nr:polyprenol monophosphomannose synthase [Anaerolineaceae bacterium]MBN2676829.1 polyprenol monophosphomannose synthase [Anaerolineaceae bacterium]
MNITIVIPTYNEAENLPILVQAFFSLPIKKLKLLIVDDNSPDGTGAIADQLQKKHTGLMQVLHRPGKMGLGTAYVTGFQMAIKDGADVVGQMDADFSHPPEKLVELAAALNECDVAVGSRYIAGGSVDKNWPIWRKMLSAFANWYARSILGMRLNDVTGGFRLYHKRVIQTLPFPRIRSSGYVFQVETAYLITLLGFKFKEVPIYFTERRLGKSKMSFRIQVEAALRVWQLLWNYRDLR